MLMAQFLRCSKIKNIKLLRENAYYMFRLSVRIEKGEKIISLCASMSVTKQKYTNTEEKLSNNNKNIVSISIIRMKEIKSIYLKITRKFYKCILKK